MGGKRHWLVVLLVVFIVLLVKVCSFKHDEYCKTCYYTCICCVYRFSITCWIRKWVGTKLCSSVQIRKEYRYIARGKPNTYLMNCIIVYMYYVNYWYSNSHTVRVLHMYYVGYYHDEMTSNRFERWWENNYYQTFPVTVSLLWTKLHITAVEVNHILWRVGQRRIWSHGSNRKK